MKKKCKENSVSYDLLTPEEISLLREEIIAEQNGFQILDGVLSDPDLIYRDIGKED